MADKVCKSRFSNCGPIKEGEDYCLFHKPEKTENEAKDFFIKLIENTNVTTTKTEHKQIVIGPTLDWSGYFFPECEHEVNFNELSIDIMFERRLDCIFSEAIFKGKINFNEAVFECRANFRGTVFSNIADFSYVQFNRNVDFGSATIEGAALFSEIIVKGQLSFYNTNFVKEVDLSGSFIKSYFSSKKATFCEDTYFEDVVFDNCVSFIETTFKKDIDFSYTVFNGVTDFSKATFSAESDFEKVHFKDRIKFNQTIFEGNSIFQEAVFDCETSFSDAAFENKVVFDWTTFKAYTDFSGNAFKNEVSFIGALFGRTCNFRDRKFYGKLFFTNANFLHGILMEPDQEEKEQGKYTLAQAEIEGCRVQRLSYEREGNREAADRVFAREMRAKRKLQGKHIFNLFETLLIDKTCKYGTSWQSLIKTSAYIILVFAFVYLITFSNIPYIGDIGQSNFYYLTTDLSLNPLLNFMNIIYESISFSLAVFTTLGTNTMHPVGPMKFVTGFQSLLGAFIVALFVVVFARKWMR